MVGIPTAASRLDASVSNLSHPTRRQGQGMTSHSKVIAGARSPITQQAIRAYRCSVAIEGGKEGDARGLTERQPATKLWAKGRTRARSNWEISSPDEQFRRTLRYFGTPLAIVTFPEASDNHGSVSDACARYTEGIPW